MVARPEAVGYGADARLFKPGCRQTTPAKPGPASDPEVLQCGSGSGLKKT
jgi:hypothetical protein